MLTFFRYNLKSAVMNRKLPLRLRLRLVWSGIRSTLSSLWTCDCQRCPARLFCASYHATLQTPTPSLYVGKQAIWRTSPPADLSLSSANLTLDAIEEMIVK